MNWTLKKEIAFIGSGGVFLGLGDQLESRLTLFTPNELERFDLNDVNAFDRGAINLNSLEARELSDYMLRAVHLLPALFLLEKNTRHDFGKIAVLWGETMVLNSGVTLVSKRSFRRPRPYVYNLETLASEKQTINAQASFISGHTSAVAANTFFLAKVFSDYHPDSDWKPVVWSLAVALPAVTAYLRVRGGRHYPTDVISGYAVGALIGYFVPHLHRHRLLHGKGLRFYGSMNGAMLMLEF